MFLSNICTLQDAVELELYFYLTKGKKVNLFEFLKTNNLGSNHLCFFRPSQPRNENEVIWSVYEWHFLSFHLHQLLMNFLSLLSLSDLFLEGHRFGSTSNVLLNKSLSSLSQHQTVKVYLTVEARDGATFISAAGTAVHPQRLLLKPLLCARQSVLLVLLTILMQALVHRCWCGCYEQDTAHGSQPLSCLPVLFRLRL